jgi:hypothetical protein
MVETYAHAVDERRLDEIDLAFERDAERDVNRHLQPGAGQASDA